MNEADVADLLAQAENALNSVKNVHTLQPEDIAKSREIVRQYEGCIQDLVRKLWSLIYNSPAITGDTEDLAHWQGRIDAYTGLILGYYQAKSVVEKDVE